MDNVFIGKIVNTHGIKGEVRIRSDFEFKNRVFVVGNEIIIDNNRYKINSYRVHKEFEMITLVGFNDINEVLKFKGKNVYIARENLHLKEDDYLISDLIGMDIINNNEVLGQVKDYMMGINPLLSVDYNGKNYYIPLNGNFIINVEKDNNKIIVSDDIRGLII